MRLLPLIVIGFALSGCAAEDVARLQAARGQTADAVARAKATDTAIRARLATLPADDPFRRALEPQVAKLDDILAREERALPVLDAAIRSAQSGTIDPSVQAAASAIPYGSLVLAAIGLIWGGVKHAQAGSTISQQQQTQAAFEQVVAALDAALPEPTAPQRAAIAGALDAQVKARVAAVKASA